MPDQLCIGYLPKNWFGAYLFNLLQLLENSCLSKAYTINP